MKELVPISKDNLELPAGLESGEIEVVLDFFEKTRYHPLHNMVLSCKQESCLYKDKCPFARINKYPKYGEDCYVELALIKIWTEQLITELDIDRENIVDQSQVRELVSLTLFENRAYMGHLCKDPQVSEVIKSIAFDGTAITEQELHPLVKQLAENSRIKSKIRQELLSTRESKSKNEIAKSESLMDKFAQLMSPEGK